MTAKGIFPQTGRASFSKLRGAFFKIPKADFRKFSIESICVVTSATMSNDNMLQLVIRGQASGHRTGLGRPVPGHSGAPKGPPKAKGGYRRPSNEFGGAPAFLCSTRASHSVRDRTGCDTDPGPEKKSCLTDFENNLAQNRFCPG